MLSISTIPSINAGLSNGVKRHVTYKIPNKAALERFGSIPV